MNALDTDIGLLSDFQLNLLTQRIEEVRQDRYIFWEAVGDAIAGRNLQSLPLSTLIKLRKHVQDAIADKEKPTPKEEESICPPESN